MTIAERLKALRSQKNLSQNQLAGMAGICTSQISHYESGRSAIGVQNLKKIAAALGCQMKDIDARCEETAAATRGANHNRYIGDDILREIVDSWRDLSAADKMEITAFVAAAKKRTPPPENFAKPENSAKKDERFANRRVKITGV
ncbi:MAG: helix-turn-helix domain-containing protein [Planctomycetota bacterium]|jgi:transcriptional regulator with XRE-family HTH domain|nr:helix-turn-helix domain-containing protein [Planctomycetota bacterium]